MCTAAAGGQRDEEVATGATNFGGLSVEALNEENKEMKQPMLNLIKRLYKKLTEWEKIDLENFVLSRREQRMKKSVAGYSNSLNLNLSLEYFFHIKKYLLFM